MNALIFDIQLLEPVLVMQVGGGDPNSAIGFDFIPGSTIRGAFIGKYLDGMKIDATDNDFRHLFFEGAIRFLDAYPQTQDKKRALPTPLSWRVEKDEKKPVYDFALRDTIIESSDSIKICKGTGKSFCYLREGEDGNNSTEFYPPNIRINVHTARNNRQTVTDEGSTIFRYQALDVGQTLSGVILADDLSDLKRIDSMFSDGTIFNLGKSHLATYGGVKIENKEIKEGWKEYESVGDDKEEDTIIITLLSDTIVRDSKTGTYIASIEPILGKFNKAFVQTRIRGGFNRTWNLPTPQTLAIRAGSVFVYKNTLELRNRLEKIKITGIGEKREEGFGRIAIDWHLAYKMDVQEPERFTPRSIAPKKESEVLALRIVNRIMQEELDQSLIKKINILIYEDFPNKSQLSRMRIIARRALSKNDPNIILKYIAGMKKKKIASSQFQRARIDGTTLEEWLIVRGENPQSIWNYLDVSSIKQPSIGGVKPEFEDFALEYTVRLIDGILKRALKEMNNE